MNFVLVTLALTCFVCVHSATWSYDDPSKWGSNYAECNGNKQSPVDINPFQAVYKPDLLKFIIDHYDSKMQYNVTNNGHTIKATPSLKNAGVSGGGLPSTYKVAQFHFHWSDSRTDKGSEHTVGHSYPLEIHIVQVNTAYPDIKEALKHSDGLAVFGFFFEVGPSNKGLAEIISKMPEYPDSSSLVSLSLTDIVGMADMSKYYRYEGSLTTPPCSEAVIWTVFHNVLTATSSEIAAFRKIKDHKSQTISNYRPVQPLNGRKIYTSIKSSDEVDCKHWTYDDTIYWNDCYSECHGKVQSPINILEGTANTDKKIGPIHFTAYDKVQEFYMKNNGHSLQLNFKRTDSSIMGGNLPAAYIAEQFHFHWDAEDALSGSEHQINGKRFPLEMHIVHVNIKYKDIMHALSDTNGLAVLSFLFEISHEPNLEMDKFLKYISETKDFKAKDDISLNLAKLIDLDNLGPYYRYKGSLTTPPCSEAVIWSVYKNPLKISIDQLKVFWSLKSENKYLHNFRPTQEMNGRLVYLAML